jgi:hypothetical protein
MSHPPHCSRSAQHSHAGGSEILAHPTLQGRVLARTAPAGNPEEFVSNRLGNASPTGVVSSLPRNTAGSAATTIPGCANRGRCEGVTGHRAGTVGSSGARTAIVCATPPETLLSGAPFAPARTPIVFKTNIVQRAPESNGGSIPVYPLVRGGVSGRLFPNFSRPCPPINPPASTHVEPVSNPCQTRCPGTSELL